MASFKRIDDLGDLSGRTALVRADLNVPMKNGEVADDARIRAVAPTVKKLREAGAKVAILAHFGRPGGKRVPEMSLKPVVPAVQDALGVRVAFGEDCVGEAAEDALQDADVAVLENLRFHRGEEANDRDFAEKLAALGDVYVNDAFSAAHRAHASTEALAYLLPAAAGEDMAAEIDALEKALESPERPVTVIIGGAKVSTKLDVLGNLITKADHLVIGGAMANTFLYAKGKDIGASLAERDMADEARRILGEAERSGCKIHLPSDAVLAKELAEGAETRLAPVTEVGESEKILDVGPTTLEALIDVLRGSKTLVWNGPLGAFETRPFDIGTMKLAEEAAKLTQDGKLLSVAGGGDTLSALKQAGAAAHFSHVSTAGGAFLEWMEGKELPGVKALQSSAG